jgi:hypothetical protein
MRDARDRTLDSELRWCFSRPVNPVYVLLGLLIAFVVVGVWERTGDDASADAPSGDSAPAEDAAEWTNRAFERGLTVVVVLVAVVAVNIGPEIVINAMWPDEPSQGISLCMPAAVRAPRAGDGPHERASLQADAAFVEEVREAMRGQGFPECPP